MTFDLGAHLAARQAQHDRDRRTVFSGLTKREQALIKDAAVMGYVRGAMAPRGAEIPGDSAVLALVVDCCLSMPDLYPAIRRAYRRGLRRADAAV